MSRDGWFLAMYTLGFIVFWLLYRNQKLYNSTIMAGFWPLTAPFILVFLLFYSVKGSAKKIMRKFTESKEDAEAKTTETTNETTKTVEKKVIYIVPKSVKKEDVDIDLVDLDDFEGK